MPYIGYSLFNTDNVNGVYTNRYICVQLRDFVRCVGITVAVSSKSASTLALSTTCCLPSMSLPWRFCINMPPSHRSQTSNVSLQMTWNKVLMNCFPVLTNVQLRRHHWPKSIKQLYATVERSLLLKFSIRASKLTLLSTWPQWKWVFAAVDRLIFCVGIHLRTITRK